MTHPRWTHALFSDMDLDVLEGAIEAAEAETSAEICVHLERRLPKGVADPLDRAREVFARLGMDRTAQRNGVLIYLAVEDHRLAVLGDEGIHARVGQEHWERVRDLMVERLRRQAPREALLDAIAEVGRALRQHFPRRPDDRNELSDRVSVE
ncbi:MAG TPA: TPM domain-containing protein [Candidatus Tectomicrobia bacterium]|nr:TPM domain-containing protein [Candidatus Tectomicrobia bacterium]